uniref:Putative h/aca ribonucleoprotein complex subunit 1 n=1 Tax=Anopheles darlingi TaxID=43151 RepID=A0A2M4D1W3_ANODA
MMYLYLAFLLLLFNVFFFVNGIPFVCFLLKIQIQVFPLPGGKGRVSFCLAGRKGSWTPGRNVFLGFFFFFFWGGWGGGGGGGLFFFPFFAPFFFFPSSNLCFRGSGFLGSFGFGIFLFFFCFGCFFVFF